MSYTGSNSKWRCQVSIMYYLATKSIIKLLYDRNDLLRYATVFQNFPQYLMVYTVEAFSKSIKFMQREVCHSIVCCTIILRVAIWSTQEALV